jgi:transcriptional regulator with XRE-family HTH domain
MDAATTLRDARQSAGMTQAALAARAGTSQATISAYESGRKEPSLTTLSRLLAATGMQLTVQPAPPPVRRPTPTELAESGRRLADVLELAAALPTRHTPTLRFPRLTA